VQTFVVGLSGRSDADDIVILTGDQLDTPQLSPTENYTAIAVCSGSWPGAKYASIVSEKRYIQGVEDARDTLAKLLAQ
jgi:hypothetical protein